MKYLTALLGLFSKHEHVDVLRSNCTYWKAVFRSQRLYLNAEVPFCVGIMGKQINLFRVAEGDRGLYASFQEFRSYEQFTGKASHVSVYASFLGK